jgi:hypothetical protein
MAYSNPKSDLLPADLRATARARTFKSAKLIYGGFSPTVIDCLVTDLSATGARVETSSMTRVPEILALRLSDGTEHQARRCWAMGAAIGLEFLPAA